ncbi:14-3-3 domain-containing protein [Mariannaea sp. PMI_226]|nr:14-3-3 domain-containing protein [Mariannaea sp. PMI_226]
MQRKKFILLARVCDEAERYDDMISLPREAINSGGKLSVDERSLLFLAFRNVVSSRRASWHIIVSVEQNESKKDRKNITTIRGCRNKLENELDKVCGDVLERLDRSLIPNDNSGELRVFYYKLKGDYGRYLAEFTSGEKCNVVVTSAKELATNSAQTELTVNHPLWLWLALNFSVFYHDALTSYEQAPESLEACA